MDKFQECWIVQWENPNTNIIIGIYSDISNAVLVGASSAIHQINEEYETVNPFKKQFITEAVQAFEEKDYNTVINLWNTELKPYDDDPIITVKMVNSINYLQSLYTGTLALDKLKTKLKP